MMPMLQEHLLITMAFPIKFEAVETVLVSQIMVRETIVLIGAVIQMALIVILVVLIVGQVLQEAVLVFTLVLVLPYTRLTL